MAPQFNKLPDGRLHFSHGPIDLVIQADGRQDAVRAAHRDAWRRFQTVLPDLVSELPALQRPVGDACPLTGTVARRMWAACHPFRASFITPMAAVAGAVAQEIIACYDRPGIDRAAVNNGGDIALHLGADASYRVGVCTDIVTATQDALRGDLQVDGAIMITSSMPVRGVATSGWGGRSFSLGIADSVTVLAASAAQADAAATVIANAVNIDDVRIKRMPANQLKDNADLGDIPVTVDVPRLESGLIDAALSAGLAQARRLQEQVLIFDAVLVCQGRGIRLLTGLHESMTGQSPCIPERLAAQFRLAGCASAALC
ncbi:MAG TPA: UPF0280 family protein [Noviherbaspirillum sp.]|jgi:hypothetical protein|uniref:UPF0280 family protein n=1 Tax=Noviherbaspirillum sp. TaxID=1926288 RepID=UPI002DDDAB56|nr:UPF0280 family protein [Noviherbaspirillum sp.]HEV2609204.1 UPF0280 family protein [Noviherbaspirillum sp.]